MKIVLATDHAGYLHKEALKKYLIEKGYQVEDFGTYSEEACDYPDFIYPAAKAVAADPEHVRGIIFGGSGQGEATVANRVRGVRATTYYHHDPRIIEQSRTHNNANVLSIGARYVTIEQMKEAVEQWLATDFPQEERHLRRIQKIDERNL
ncbi:MAG: RpiB/LacA/LacB family sugar-phosphate isomerase [bacterium]|nr:RpiB/LacA/LacB family sugar-phosphate isomerase [bacterium]